MDKTATLPCDFASFLSAGNTPPRPESRRNFQRLRFRGRAVLKHDHATSGVYTLDVSPNGMAFFCPVQLFPKCQVKLLIGQFEELALSVVQCRRVQQDCYRCGTTFADGPMSPVRYRDFLRILQDRSGRAR